MLLLKALGVWLLILAGAILNGWLREAVLLPALGKTTALGLSGISLSALVVAVAVAFIRLLKVTTVSQSMRVGLFWLVLTLGFESGFGRLVQGQTWREILEAYTFRDGNIWPVVPVAVLFAPLLALRLRRPEGPSVRRQGTDPAKMPGW